MYDEKCLNMGCVKLNTPPKQEPIFTNIPEKKDDTQFLFCQNSNTPKNTSYNWFIRNVYATNSDYACVPETLPLVQTTVASNQSTLTDSSYILDPVDLATGDFTYTNTFLTLPGITGESAYSFILNYRSRTEYE